MKPAAKREDDPSSVLASLCIEATLKVKVERWDVPGREGVHDLNYENEGLSVAVEVKRVVSPAFRAAESAASRVGYTRDGRLTSLWNISLGHEGSWNRARRSLPELLVILEQRGWQGGQLWELRQLDCSLYDVLTALDIQSAWRHSPTPMHPPGFYLMPEGWGGAVPSIDNTAEFASELLASESMTKLRLQLKKAKTDLRQAFLFIGHEHLETIPLSDGSADLPHEAPNLPDPIDGLWLASTLQNSRVIAFLLPRGWINGRFPSEP
jgi:hypothetical protein